ncbi:hypothetical protein niasHT_020688 [Heterodera trifolii]|uniref:BTB domain-containing protein n=1 Tax=Heterodera trifolii TaxID=157864 RepID=A0ABD2KM17_9BILA
MPNKITIKIKKAKADDETSSEEEESSEEVTDEEEEQSDEEEEEGEEQSEDDDDEQEEVKEMPTDGGTDNTLANRMAHLLSTGNGADVHFLVGQGDKKEQLSAHSPILISASSVFASMFLQQSDDSAGPSKVRSPVEVADVEIGPFKTMLRYIYLDDLNGLNDDTLFEVLFVAKKYKVNGLIKACADFPIWKLRNVFIAYSKANSLGEKDFARRCLHYIDWNADSLIGSKKFLQIDQKLLCEMLDRVQLKINGEITIWKAALRWADEKCRENGEECSAKNQRVKLGPALYKIRFTHMPKEEFAKEIVPSGVLTMAELISVLLFHAHPNRGISVPYPLKFATQRRTLSKHIDAYVCPVLTLRVDHLSAFVREGSDRRISDAVHIKGLPWMILAALVSDPSTKEKFLGFYLRCGEENDSEWSCCCSATFRIVSQKESKKDFSRKLCHFFHANSADRCGFYNFMTIERLMNQRNGWYDSEKDCAVLEVDIDMTNAAAANGTQKRRWSDAF